MLGPQKKQQKTTQNKSTLEGYIRWLLLPLFLIIVLLSLIIVSENLRSEVSAYEFAQVSSQVPVYPYPFLRTENTPLISAQAGIIMDDTSKVIVYEKNADLRFSMASTTKVMTALVALDFFKPDDLLTVKTATVEGTIVGFQKGEQYYFDDVMYALLLPSGNDAAHVIADNYPGGISQFVLRMNEKAQELQLKETNYADPAGLLDDEDYTTARDLVRLASEAMQNKTIARMVSTKQRTITTANNSRMLYLENLNKLLGTYNVIGIKTGLTEGAGGVLMTATKQNGHTFLLVVMKSEDRFLDTEMLLYYLSNNLSYFPPDVSMVAYQ